jgi:hypothetical protein
MDEITKENLDKQIATAVIVTLKKEGAERVADNLKPDGVRLPDLLLKLADLGFNISAAYYYNRIRPKCIELGYSVVASGKGQYIGSRGEWTLNIKNARDQLIGRTVNQKRILTAAGEALSLEDGNKYCLQTFKMDLGTAAKLFKVVGELTGINSLPWPAELNLYLEESNGHSSGE